MPTKRVSLLSSMEIQLITKLILSVDDLMNISYNLLKIKYFLDYFSIKITPFKAHWLTHIVHILTHIVQIDTHEGISEVGV